MMITREAATALRSPSGPGQRVSWPAWAGRWLGVGFAIATVGWGANQFTPMLLLYRPLLGLSAATVEATFGMYAIGLIPGLLVAGRVSDRIGRRPVVTLAVALSVVAAVVLMLASHGTGWLFAGRVIMGVASGCAFSAGSAWIKELSAPPHEHAAAGSGARRAGAAMTVGFGAGPLVAGAAAQWAPLPTTLPYVPQLVLAALAIPLIARTPETITRRAGLAGAGDRTGTVDRAGSGGWRLPVHGIGEPRFVRVVLPLAPWVFGSAAISMVFVPGLVISRVHGAAIFFGALAALCTAAAGVLVQPLARRLDRPDRPRLLVIGMSLVTVGLLAEAGVAAIRQPVLVLAAAALLGCGYGFCLVFGLAEVQRLARPAELAGMTAVFQAVTYVGFGAPYLLSVLHAYAPASALLLAMAALGAVTLVFTVSQARR
jgi:MFS family permease